MEQSEGQKAFAFNFNDKYFWHEIWYLWFSLERRLRRKATNEGHEMEREWSDEKKASKLDIISMRSLG